MNSQFTLPNQPLAEAGRQLFCRVPGCRLLPLLAGAWLALGLASCSQPADTATSAAPAAVMAAAPAPAAAPAARPDASAAPATKATKAPDKAKPKKPVPAVAAVAAPLAAPAAPVAEEAPAPTPAPAPATRTQAGRVLDEAGQPLVGATVMLKGSSTITSTDANGSYSFEVPTGENTFVVGYGGYQDEVAKSRSGEPLTVTLLPTPGASKARKKRR